MLLRQSQPHHGPHVRLVNAQSKRDRAHTVHAPLHSSTYPDSPGVPRRPSGRGSPRQRYRFPRVIDDFAQRCHSRRIHDRCHPSPVSTASSTASSCMPLCIAASTYRKFSPVESWRRTFRAGRATPIAPRCRDAPAAWRLAVNPAMGRSGKSVRRLAELAVLRPTSSCPHSKFSAPRLWRRRRPVLLQPGGRALHHRSFR